MLVPKLNEIDMFIQFCKRLGQYCFEIYIQWAKESKGMANPTLEGRKHKLLSFVTYTHQRNLSVRNLEIYDVDKYIGYRHNYGCGSQFFTTIVTTLRYLIKYAYIQGWCKNIASEIRHPKQFSLEK